MLGVNFSKGQGGANTHARTHVHIHAHARTHAHTHTHYQEEPEFWVRIETLASSDKNLLIPFNNSYQVR
jgi:hypothetical protein